MVVSLCDSHCYEDCYSEDGTLVQGQAGDVPEGRKDYISNCSTWEEMTLIPFA